MFSEPSEGYHGLNFWKTFGEHSPFGNIAFALRCRVEGLRDLGPVNSPFNSFLLLQGLETLSLRAERINLNTLEIARWLEAHSKVEKVNYPGLENNKYHTLAKKYLRKTILAGISFFVKEMWNKVPASSTISMISHVANVGDARTLIIHPQVPHQQLPEEARIAAAYPNMLRLSVGMNI